MKSVPDLVKPSFVFFDIWALWPQPWSSECPNTKNYNDDLTRSGSECFTSQLYGNSGHQRV